MMKKRGRGDGRHLFSIPPPAKSCAVARQSKAAKFTSGVQESLAVIDDGLHQCAMAARLGSTRLKPTFAMLGWKKKNIDDVLQSLRCFSFAI